MRWNKPVIFLVQAYRKLLSQFMLPACRFLPSCSEYAEQALSRHGFFRGALLTAQRLAKCQPFGGSGWDPVQ